MINLVGVLYGHFARRRQLAHLEELDDHLLADIGITRAELRRTPARRSVVAFGGAVSR